MIVNQVVLSDAKDQRRGPFFLAQGKLDSGSLLQSKDSPPHPAPKFICESRAPPLVRFFVWLLVHGRAQCRSNLFRKTIVDSPTCEVCNQANETCEHIVVGCPSAEEFWGRLGFQPGPTKADGCILNINCPSHYPSKHFPTFAALRYWHLWKRRNTQW